MYMVHAQRRAQYRTVTWSESTIIDLIRGSIRKC